jgi:hypothetical protein
MDEINDCIINSQKELIKAQREHIDFLLEIIKKLKNE